MGAVPFSSVTYSLRSDDAALAGGVLGIVSDEKRGSLGTRRRIIELYDQFRPSLYGYLIPLGLAPQQADDAVQETFLRLFEHLQSSGNWMATCLIPHSACRRRCLANTSAEATLEEVRSARYTRWADRAPSSLLSSSSSKSTLRSEACVLRSLTHAWSASFWARFVTPAHIAAADCLP
jgi:hypothetical protein